MPDIASILTVLSIVVFSTILPIGILVTRDNVKSRRQEIIQGLEEFFRSSSNSQSPNWAVLPSFEFVKTKYLMGRNAKGSDLDLKWFSIPVIAFIVVSLGGFILAFAVSDSHCFELANRKPDLCLIAQEPLDATLFLIGGQDFGQDAAKRVAYHRTALTMIVFAFLGAYVAAIRTMLRAIANFDLSPLTFFRSTAGILGSIFIVVVLWRSIPDLGDTMASAMGTGWLLAAFALGFFPNLSERMLAALWRRGRIKRMDERATDSTRIVPLELLDGIDGDVRSRLEDFNLYDVQNLATANPIMLFVETPFGIYQSIDWVAQAQLATAVGVERFLILRDMGIRTIFDLERAFHDSWAGDKRLQARIGAVLVRPPGPPAGISPDDIEPLVGEGQALVALILDDLATLRLRQLWLTIQRRLGPYDRLDGPVPCGRCTVGAAPCPRCPARDRLQLVTE